MKISSRYPFSTEYQLCLPIDVQKVPFIFAHLPTAAEKKNKKDR